MVAFQPSHARGRLYFLVSSKPYILTCNLVLTNNTPHLLLGQVKLQYASICRRSVNENSLLTKREKGVYAIVKRFCLSEFV